MTRTEIIPTQKAGQIQRTAADFDCELIELGISGNNMAKVTVSGDEQDVERIFKSIE
jgi:hypothetical protein